MGYSEGQAPPAQPLTKDLPQGAPEGGAGTSSNSGFGARRCDLGHVTSSLWIWPLPSEGLGCQEEGGSLR